MGILCKLLGYCCPALWNCMLVAVSYDFRSDLFKLVKHDFLLWRQSAKSLLFTIEAKPSDYCPLTCGASGLWRYKRCRHKVLHWLYSLHKSSLMLSDGYIQSIQEALVQLSVIGIQSVQRSVSASENLCA